jgi:hypothetical protein
MIESLCLGHGEARYSLLRRTVRRSLWARRGEGSVGGRVAEGQDRVMGMPFGGCAGRMVANPRWPGPDFSGSLSAELNASGVVK